MRIGGSARKLPSRLGMSRLPPDPAFHRGAQPPFCPGDAAGSRDRGSLIAILLDALAVGKRWAAKVAGRLDALGFARRAQIAIAATHSHSSSMTAICEGDVFAAAEPDEATGRIIWRPFGKPGS